MSFLREAINRILELAPVKDSVFLTDDREYSSRDLRPIKPPLCDPVDIHTLSGLADWVSHEKEDTPIMLHVVDYRTVHALGELTLEWRQRETLARCEMFRTEEFPFGHFMQIEDFIINTQSKFVQTEELKHVIDTVSRVTGETVTIAEDDGSAQMVTTKNAVGRKENKEIKAIVNLRPYRTFREVEQPESAFLLRFRKPSDDSIPLAALFEADGGAWKNDAIKHISDYLKSCKLGVEIIA